MQQRPDDLRAAPLWAETPPEARLLAADAYALLPRPRVTDLLLEVDGWTGFTGCFTHALSCTRFPWTPICQREPE